MDLVVDVVIGAAHYFDVDSVLTAFKVSRLLVMKVCPVESV